MLWTPPKISVQAFRCHLMLNPRCSEAKGLLADFIAVTSFLAEAKRQFCSHKAKIDHLNLMDRNLKYFHALVKRNQKHNFIVSISCRDGNLSTFTTKVTSEFSLRDWSRMNMDASQPMHKCSGHVIAHHLNKLTLFARQSGIQISSCHFFLRK